METVKCDVHDALTRKAAQRRPAAHRVACGDGPARGTREAAGGRGTQYVCPCVHMASMQCDDE